MLLNNKIKLENNSNKDCDWLILACFIREQSTADTTAVTPLENKIGFENLAECVRKLLGSYHETNKEASTRSRICPYTSSSCSTASCMRCDRTEYNRNFFIYFLSKTMVINY